MPRYKALPAELDPCARQLVARLRQLKDHSELTMRHLAAKTGYSAKSWERYLGGTLLPPREAVEALARITGAEPVPLLALHEIAADTWGSRRASPVVQPRPTTQKREGDREEKREQEREQSESPARPDPGPPATPTALTTSPTTGPATGRFPHIALTAGIVALAVALLATLLLMLRLGEDITPAAVAAPPPTTAASPRTSYTCRITRLDDRWSAGINNGRNTEIFYGATGADVAEAQCLLRRAGISPGGIDGMFGPLTLRAVKTLQQREGMVADGMLGPRSWKALRG
ncbi:peptidoglycan-binding protein [Streptomyces sp. NPDC050535]|uniref:peptidoglycan-binding protein n=1 Tax=Streptomyces sp. NPDC050535 TaxID=3365626 RepID=UPI00378AB932